MFQLSKITFAILGFCLAFAQAVFALNVATAANNQYFESSDRTEEFNVDGHFMIGKGFHSPDDDTVVLVTVMQFSNAQSTPIPIGTDSVVIPKTEKPFAYNTPFPYHISAVGSLEERITGEGEKPYYFAVAKGVHDISKKPVLASYKWFPVYPMVEDNQQRNRVMELVEENSKMNKFKDEVNQKGLDRES